MELGKISLDKLETYAFSIFDTLKLAKEIRPGQRNNLDALCRAYDIDNTSRSFHGALLDAQLLGDVYLGMTRGQEAFSINFSQSSDTRNLKDVNQKSLVITKPSKEEMRGHDELILNLKGGDSQ